MSDVERSNIPRIVLAALKGGAGKTFLTVGVVAALRKRGLNLSVFKKGPDYIDAGWLGLAAGEPCYNLDAYLFDREVVRGSFSKRSSGKDAAIVEGNRGLFDGVDAAGSYSTAELAKILRAPVVLIVDATKVTRTAAAEVLGCQLMDPALELKAIILNRVAGARHERILREAIEAATSIPVIGSVGKLSLINFPQRHFGLLPLQEHPQATDCVEQAGAMVRQSVDLDRLLEIAASTKDFQLGALTEMSEHRRNRQSTRLRIGIVKDSAFQFYYPENLEALGRRGAKLVEISSLFPAELPDLDGLYIGGGFPETHAEALAGNSLFKESLLKAVEDGLPVYGECGGLIYLSRSLRIDERVYPMAGVFPIDTVMQRKPQGLGYIHVKVTGSNPFYPVGTELTGHEFHYSSVSSLDNADGSLAFRVLRGRGMDGFRDGICTRNALGTYLHLHALGEPLWAEAFVAKASEFHALRVSRTDRDLTRSAR
ncbi:MAG: cobyrinate a,c-diamide synthase [Desulfomonilaceae bacterium]